MQSSSRSCRPECGVIVRASIACSPYQAVSLRSRAPRLAQPVHRLVLKICTLQPVMDRVRGLHPVGQMASVALVLAITSSTYTLVLSGLQGRRLLQVSCQQPCP